VTDHVATYRGMLGWPRGAENTPYSEPLSTVSQMTNVPFSINPYVEPRHGQTQIHEEVVSEGYEAIEEVAVRVPEETGLPDQHEEASSRRPVTSSAEENEWFLRNSR
jgi:hypothetical protein